MDIKYIEKKLERLIEKANNKNEVPVAALIVCNDKIISKAYNKVNNKNTVLNHAEILAIKKASKKLKNWRLNDCKMYVTLEPCSMCKEVIKKCRLNEVYYFVKQNSNKTESEINYYYLNNDNFSLRLKSFFQNKR